jgi:hypothetical protein
MVILDPMQQLSYILLLMSSSIHSSILRALFVAIKPLARALLRAGIGYREFADVAKAAFVHEASKDFGLRGRPTNTSRVAVMTGITRKEVKRIRESDVSGLFFEYTASISPAALILEAWHSDPKYLDERGAPKVLEYDNGTSSFMSLVKKFAGDIPVGAMKSELSRILAIRELPDKKIEVLKRRFVPSGLDARFALGMEAVVAADLSTLAHNCDPKRREPMRFHLLTSVDALTSSQLETVENEARKRLQELSDSFEDFLFTQRTDAAKENRLGTIDELPNNMEAGIGLFYFQRQTE